MTAKQADDLGGAIDAIERRVAHLSTLVYPDPGVRPLRSAHWRDEVELKALRVGVKAIREKQARAGAEDEHRETVLLKGLTDALDLLERVVGERRVSSMLLAEAERLIERLDVVIEDAE